MSDFASAVMVRLMVKGMEALGLDTSVLDLAAVKGTAQVPLDTKRQVIEAATSQAGLSCLLRLGRGGGLNAEDPTHRALLAAPDAVSLIDRWRRLETYVHSQHRVVQVKSGGTEMVLRHQSLIPGQQPHAFEDFVVLGVLAALLEAIGLMGVSAEIGGKPVYPVAVESDLQQLVNSSRTGTWRVSWKTPVNPTIAADAAAVSGNLRAMTPLNLCQSLPWPETAHQCAAILLSDILQKRSVADLACRLGMSARSLQRTLTLAGLSYSTIASEVRLRSAAWWLLESSLPIVEVGYVCGYCDQPHFTRDFKRQIGLSPLAYRQGFAGGKGVIDHPSRVHAHGTY